MRRPSEEPSPTTLAAACASVASTLRDAGVPTPDVDARWLVAAAAGVDPRRAPDGTLDTAAVTALDALVARRCDREPLQRVVGTAPFRDLELTCRPGVFVPRPETEVLVDLALGLVDEVGGADGGPVVVHEPCCGSGAIGLALATERCGLVVLQGDRSQEAVAATMADRDRLAHAGRLRSTVQVLHGDLLDAFAATDRPVPDVVVANPPYLPQGDLVTLEPEVVDHDPHAALVGGPDGHEVVDALLAVAADRLRPGGGIALEIDARRAVEVVAAAGRAGLVDVTVRRDLTGADRFIVARRPGRPPMRR